MFFINNFKLILRRSVSRFKMPTLTPKNISDMNPEDVQKFINSFDTVLTDCDGVLWYENEVIYNSNHTMNKFRELGKKIFYVTNNSTKTREEFLSKCERLGFEAYKEEMISTSYLAASYLKDQGFNKRVYVIGCAGIIKELDKLGISHTDIGPDRLESDIGTYVTTKLSLDDDIGAVIVGFDEHFSYPKMLKAASYLNDSKCLFIATNTDERLPVRPNLIIPGTGSMVRCIETCAGRKAFCVGKPNKYIRDAIVKVHGIDPSRTLMIGDRCNTDILFGKRCGFTTLLVLSGVTTIEEVDNWAVSENPEEKELVPNYFIDKLGNLLPLMS